MLKRKQLGVLSRNELFAVRRLRKAGKSLDEIATTLNRPEVTPEIIEREHKAMLELRRQIYERTYGRKRSKSGLFRQPEPKHIVRNPIILPDEPRSLTGTIFGDPTPSRSALAKAQPWRPYGSVSLAGV